MSVPDLLEQGVFQLDKALSSVVLLRVQIYGSWLVEISFFCLLSGTFFPVSVVPLLFNLLALPQRGGGPGRRTWLVSS